MLYFFYHSATAPSGQRPPNYWGFVIKFRHHTRKESSGRVTSPSQRPLPVNTQHSQEKDIHAPGGIRTHNSSKCAAANPYVVQGGARKTGPPSRRPTWAYFSDSVQKIKQMQMQSTYSLQKVLKMISLYVDPLLCTLQHIVKHIDVQGDHLQHLL
jgi:hypothetical protein